VVNTDTTFTALGHGFDPLMNDISFANDYTGEKDTVDVDVIAPNTVVTISANATMVYSGGAVDLTVYEENTGDVPLTSPSVDVNPGGYTLNKASGYYVEGDTDGDGVLNATEKWKWWKWVITGVVVNTDTTFTALGHGFDPLMNDISFANDYTGEKDTVDVDVINPHTTLTAFTYVYDTVSGNVEITITDCNDGDAPLTDAVVHLRANDVEYGFSPMGRSSSYFDSGDDNPNPGDLTGVLDPDECWTWVVNVLDNPVTYDPDTGEGLESEYQSFRIEVGNATRTWGFWKTHLWLVDYMLGGSTELDPLDDYYTAVPIVTLPIYFGNWTDGDGYVSNNCTYMALMWAKQSHNSDGVKREKIDAARIHTAHQALAAIMNSYMPGGESLPAGINLTSIADTLSSDDITAIRNLGSALANYNESGDDEALDPSLPPTGRVYDDNIADPQGGRAEGAPCETSWDTPVPLSVASGGKGKGKNK